MDEERSPRRRFTSLSTEHKVAFVLLMFLGIGGAVFGMRSFGAYVDRPFQIQLAEYAKKGEFLTLEQQEEKEQAEQKKKDTDEDGLNDYDELYVFKTSPYLKDTDSDGLDDKAEVFEGSDPTCPKGKECGTQAAVAREDALYDADVNQAIADSFGIDPSIGGTSFEDSLLAGTGTSADSLSGIGIESPADIMSFLENLSVEEIRAALVQSGIDPNMLEGVSDEELRQLFDEATQTAAESGEFERILEETPTDL